MTSEKLSDTLKDVVAFVDVWSSSRTENYSKPFIQQLQEMGAEVSKTFDKHVTHVVFKNGHQHTWNKAKKRGVKLVSVLWVARCNDCGEHIDEELCPAVNEGTHRNPTLNKRTHRCMQPRDIPEKTPENNKLMKRKLDRMMKSLEVSSFSSPDAPDASPFLIDKASGVIYSPSSQRASDMAQRLKVMKERRESLSRLDSCDEDDSSDLDTSFSDFHSSSTGSKSEATKGEVQHPHKTPTFDLGTTGSDIEMNRSATELPRTDTKKQAFVCHRAKKETAERPCPQGPRSERKPPERQKLSNSSIQSGALECPTSLESPRPGVLLAEGVNTQSPVGLDGWVIRKQRESSFKCDQAEKARSQSPGVTEPFGGSKSTPSVESKRVLNTEGTDPCGQTKASKVYSLFRAVGRSVSLPVSAGESLIRKAAVGVRKRARSRKQEASPLQAFFFRKSASLPLDARGSTQSPRPSSPTDEGAFENYFSPVNHSENGRTASLGLPSEPSPLPPIEEEPKPRKRKRGRSEAGSPGLARAKRRVSLSNVN